MNIATGHIDLQFMEVSLVKADIKSQWQAHFFQIFPVDMDKLPKTDESDRKVFETHWKGPEQITYDQFMEMHYKGWRDA